VVILVFSFVKSIKYFRLVNKILKFRQTIAFILKTTGAYLALGGALASLVWLEGRVSSLPQVKSGAWESETQKIPLVLIDAGHGGHDGGAVANGLIEKNLTLEIATLLRDELIAKGLRVQMTREKDMFLPLESRAAQTARTGAAVFISVHINTDGKGSDADGIETYFAGRPSLATARRQVSTISRGNEEALARLVQRHVCETTGANNRGIKQRDYVVIEEASCPALLVECGFLTNRQEAQRLKEAAHQQKIAQGIAAGVAQYLQTRPSNALVASSTAP
jgi:N-acetylmuramoyl-L-alanine amidase